VFPRVRSIPRSARTTQPEPSSVMRGAACRWAALPPTPPRSFVVEDCWKLKKACAVMLGAAHSTQDAEGLRVADGYGGDRGDRSMRR